MSFPRYPKYRASGVEWLGEVPAHWLVLPMKHLVSLRSGGTPSKENAAYWDGDVPWASSKDLKRAELHDTEDHITQLAVEEGAADLVPVGSLLVVVRGMILAHSFPVARVMVPMAINQDLKAVRPKSELTEAFLAWLLQGSIVETFRRMEEAAHGTKVLRLESWTAMQLPVPPPREQAAVAGFLDRETAKIDALVAEQQRLIDLLKEKRQAVISHAVTKGLDPNATMKPSGIEWLGDVPAHWESTRLRALFKQAKRQDQESKPVLSVYRDLGVVLKDSRDDNNNKTPEDLSLYQLVQPGDLVVNKMKAWQGSLGISSVEGITSPDYAVFVPQHSEEGSFLHQLLRSAALVSQYLRISNGIRLDQWRLETDHFLNVRVFLPPRDEQRAIAEYLRRQHREIGDLADEAERAVTLLQERRTALISAAVTGQIDVTQLPKATA